MYQHKHNMSRGHGKPQVTIPPMPSHHYLGRGGMVRHIQHVTPVASKGSGPASGHLVDHYIENHGTSTEYSLTVEIQGRWSSMIQAHPVTSDGQVNTRQECGD